MSEIKVGEYISKEDFLKKNDSIVCYALYVQDNIKKDDYARLNTGQIVKVLYIKENNCTKKAIYYGIYDNDWFDCSAVENFSNNIIDLIEVGDYVNGWQVQEKYKIDTGEWCISENCGDSYYDNYAYNKDIETVVTKEQFSQMEYKVEE